MFLIKSSIKIKDDELIQKQYITDNFIVNEINNQKHIYISGNNLLQVDNVNKTLREINYLLQIDQINKIKQMLGEIKSEELGNSGEILGIQSKGLKFYNSNEAMRFNMVSHIISVPGIEKTIYSDFINNEQNKQLVKLELNKDELVGYTLSEIYSNGNLVQKQTIKIISIEKDLDDNEEFYEYLTYSHE